VTILADWQRFFLQADRVHEIADGILVDRRCKPARGQEEERHLRDAVAEPFLKSAEVAIREATRHHSKEVMLRRARQQVAKALTSPAGTERIVLDLGCGFGWHWTELSARNPSVRFILMDFSIPNLRICRMLMPVERHPNVLCVQASILDLPIRDAVVDLCWSVQVMQHIPKSERMIAFREMRRVLKPGAAFYIAWLRQVPAVKAMFALFRKRYHRNGETPQGLYLDRFDDSIRDELRTLFPSGATSRSESLFHPELKLRPRARWIGAIDMALSDSPLGGAFARQAEFSGLI